VHATSEVHAAFEPADPSLASWSGTLRQITTVSAIDDEIDDTRTELTDGETRTEWDQPIPAVDYPGGTGGTLHVDGVAVCQVFWLNGTLLQALG
jgi:hypothetical protein